MMRNQVKLGPELLNASRESWISYYVFAFGAIATLGGGYAILRASGLVGSDYWLALLGVLILAAVFGGIAIVCHLMGHLFDELAEMRDAQPSRTAVPVTTETKAPSMVSQSV